MELQLGGVRVGADGACHSILEGVGGGGIGDDVEVSDAGGFFRDFSFGFPDICDFSFRFHKTDAARVIAPKVSAS